MMKLSKKFSTLMAGTLVTLMAVFMGATGNASAASTAQCLYQYNANGFPTSATPVFNSICGVNEGIGNEPDFVRIRQSTNGNDEDNTNNPNYSVGSISAACTPGQEFDLWNYVHNNATQADNPDVGDGSAVAKNVAIDMTAPLNSTQSSFNFTSTITADNASNSGISDDATLDCGTNQVQLQLVPASVHVYSQPYGAWQNLPDGSVNNSTSNVNTPLPLGSTNAGLSSLGQGSEWGCWTYRIVIVYEVKVVAAPVVVTPPTCNLLQLENDNGVARIDNVEYTANSANVTGFDLTIVNGSNTTTKHIALNQLPFNFPLTAGQTYNFTANVDYTLSGKTSSVTGTNCVGTITTSTPTTTPPPATTPPAAPTTTLPNTGPGDVAAIFGGTTVAGAGFYNWFLKKRLVKR